MQNFDPNVIINTYWDGYIPVNYYNIFRMMNIPVIETSLDKGIVAVIEKENDSYIISIEKNSHLNTLVLAFCLCHMNYGIDNGKHSVLRSDFNTGASFEKQQIQKKLPLYLVPQRTLTYMISNGQTSFKSLAQSFAVSEVLMLKALEKYKIMSK